MQILDCLPLMTKSYISRIVDSVFQESIPKGNEEQLKEQIEQNIDKLANKDRIKKSLDFVGMKRSNRILSHIILLLLLEKSDHASSEEELYKNVKDYEQSIIEKSKDPDVFKYSDERSIDIYITILSVALNDADISEDEFQLLEKLRQKLKINRLEHQIMESQLNMYPQEGNTLHTYEDFKQAHLELQKRGILFYCNHADPCSLVALPDEIAKAVAIILNFEMRKDAKELLYNTLTLGQMKNAAREQGLPISGTKQQLIERFIEAQCIPSEILAALSLGELTEICRKLPGVPSSGSKSKQIHKILDYFASLTEKPLPNGEDSRETYYHYLEELAERNNKELYRLGIIKRDRDMEQYFEEGTRYLFEKKLGCTLMKFEGVDHADGSVAFPNGELLLWDNKGKEQQYRFPKSHADQFLRYIRESTKRVNVFLVVVPELSEGVEQQAMHLRYRNNTDTDIALITAHDLKFVAEKWMNYSKDGVFNLNVFNTTGILDRIILEERMKLLLA